MTDGQHYADWMLLIIQLVANVERRMMVGGGEGGVGRRLYPAKGEFCMLLKSGPLLSRNPFNTDSQLTVDATGMFSPTWFLAVSIVPS
jgi:hypothetical protein